MAFKCPVVLQPTEVGRRPDDSISLGEIMIYHSCFHITREVDVGSGHTCCFRLIFVDVPRRGASDPIRNYHVNLPRLQGHVLLASNILRARYCSSSCAYQSFFFWLVKLHSEDLTGTTEYFALKDRALPIFFLFTF